ncbi:hypothetical protein [Clostridium omnivorum]|uniref:MetS family NSS transporter small subunit n=1 Tax=Clostridium omnivorum TaxID=1604902 RepID=A0ABQ5N695_9CLOT|nr:hypothetical protein [Clostridium sp. E14]GLC30733.1 hypothetical protein bsdE14_21430 [Clostridium sp. E14]
MNAQDILIAVVIGVFAVGGAWFTIASHIEGNKQSKNNDNK